MLSAEYDKLAKACQADQPCTSIERWRSVCPGVQLAQLLENGRDVTIIVGKRTDKKRGDFAVVLAEERN